MRMYQQLVCALLAMFLIHPSIRTSQPNSRTTLSSMSAQAQSSTTSTTLQSCSEREKVIKVIDLGNKARAEGNRELAITYMRHAHNNSARFPQLRTQAAANLGMLLFMRGDHVDALPLLTEAYTAILQLKRTPGYKRGQDKEHVLMTQTVLAGFLARVYLLDAGVKPNYEKAFNYLSTSAESSSNEVRSIAKAFLGKMYIEGLGKQQDVEQARKYFGQALQQAQTECGADNAINGLLTTIAVQIHQFNTYRKEQLTRLTGSFTTNTNKLQKASKLLQEIQATQQMLPQYVAFIFTSTIANAQEQIQQIQAQIELRQNQTQEQQESTLITSLVKLTLTETPSAPSQQASLKTLKEHATDAYEAFLKKPSAARYQEAVYALRELIPLTIDNPELNKETLHKLGCIANREVEQQKSVSTGTTTKGSKTESTRWLLCDPFEQIEQFKTFPALQSKLDQLAQDYLEVSDVKKLHGFTNLWRTRVGNLRIIYTVLAQQHAIGIVQIDQRKDVYDKSNLKALKELEDWFYGSAGIAFLEKSLKQSETKKS